MRMNVNYIHMPTMRVNENANHGGMGGISEVGISDLRL